MKQGLTYGRKFHIWAKIFDFRIDFMPGRSGTIPGHEIAPGIRISAWKALKTIKNDEKLRIFKIHEISHEMHSPVDFSPSNIQISHADACVRCCEGTPTPRDRPRTYVSMGNLNI